MAACSNGHSNPENEIYCGKREASVVALNQGLLAHSSTAGMGPEPQESLPGIASAQRLPPIAVALLFAVIAAVICVAVTFAISDSRTPIRGHSLPVRPATPSARTDQPSSDDRGRASPLDLHRAARISKDSWVIPVHDAIPRIQQWRLAEHQSR